MQILDYGLLRVEDMAMTEAPGTRAFLSPEMLPCCRRYSAAVDIWAVGLVFISMFPRRLLFTGITGVSHIHRVIHFISFYFTRYNCFLITSICNIYSCSTQSLSAIHYSAPPESKCVFLLLQ